MCLSLHWWQNEVINRLLMNKKLLGTALTFSSSHHFSQLRAVFFVKPLLKTGHYMRDSTVQFLWQAWAVTYFTGLPLLSSFSLSFHSWFFLLFKCNSLATFKSIFLSNSFMRVRKDLYKHTYSRSLLFTDWKQKDLVTVKLRVTLKG